MVLTKADPCVPVVFACGCLYRNQDQLKYNAELENDKNNNLDRTLARHLFTVSKHVLLLLLLYPAKLTAARPK